MGVISFVFIGIGFFFLLLGVIISSSKKSIPLHQKKQNQINDTLQPISSRIDISQNSIDPATLRIHENAATIKEQNKSLEKNIEMLSRDISDIRSKNTPNTLRDQSSSLIQHLQNEIFSLKNLMLSPTNTSKVNLESSKERDLEFQLIKEKEKSAEKEMLLMKEQFSDLKSQLYEFNNVNSKQQVIKLKEQLSELKKENYGKQKYQKVLESIKHLYSLIEEKSRSLQPIKKETTQENLSPNNKSVLLQDHRNNPYLFSQEQCYLYLDSSEKNTYTGADSNFSIQEASGIKRIGKGALSYDGSSFYFRHDTRKEIFHLKEIQHISLYPNCLILVHKLNRPTAIIFMETTKELKSTLSTFS